MKNGFFLTILLSNLCISCTSISFPYLNEKNELFEEGYSSPSICMLTMGGGKEGNRFGYHFMMQGKSVSFKLHAFTLCDRDGDTIPYTLSYLIVLPPDSLIVSNLDSMPTVFFSDTIPPHNAMVSLDAISEKTSNSVKVYYDFEINGERKKGSCYYRKRMVINSRPSFPRQPWIL